MKKLTLFNINTSSLPTCSRVLVDWVVAADSFYTSYFQLKTYIDQTVTEQCINTIYLSQCLVNQLTNLITVMEEELQKLVDELDQPAELEQSTISQRYEKLLTHAQILDRLSQEARRLLLLANCRVN